MKLTFAKAECLGALAVGPCWLLMARAVARRPPLRWPAMLALWTLPALCVPIVVTNWRGLVWPSVSVVVTSAGVEGRYDYGAFLWAVIALTYLAGWLYERAVNALLAQAALQHGQAIAQRPQARWRALLRLHWRWNLPRRERA